MTDVLRIKRRTTGAPGAPTALASAELAFNEVDGTLYYGQGNVANQATSIIPIGGSGLTMGGSSSYSGAVTFLSTTKLSSAIESLNSVLSHLVPTAPTNFPTGSFTLTSTGTSPVLAAGGVTDHTSGTSGLSAGSSVTRLTSSTVTTSVLNWNNQSPNGLAADLILTLMINGASSGTYTFTDVTASGNTDNGTHSGIVISAQAAFPSGTPGFWKSFSVGVNSASGLQGINKLQLTSNEEGNSNTLYWVQDNINTAPAVTGTSLALLSNGTVAYSSSVPHFNTTGTLTGNLSISNLAGETYYNGNPLSITGSNSIIAAQSYSYATLGITTPIARQITTATAVTPFTINVSGTNVFASGTISGTATNVTGNSSLTALATTTILVKNGAYATLDEANIVVSGLGSLPNTNNAVRVVLTADASGVDVPTSAAYTTWSSSAALPTYSAAVVAGVLSCNKTNYASGYLPAGPNLSGQDSAQYVTFAFQRSSASSFVINVTGTYAHCWIALPGVSDNSGISPNSKGGVWWDTAVAYQGVGVPGDASNPNAGCGFNTSNTMTGSSGAFQMVFGAQSSSNATGNNILVRFRLNTGQSITALSFS